MIFKLFFKPFLAEHKKDFIFYTLVIISLAVIESLYLPKLYSKLIDKSKILSKIKSRNNQNTNTNSKPHPNKSINTDTIFKLIKNIFAIQTFKTLPGLAFYDKNNNINSIILLIFISLITLAFIYKLETYVYTQIFPVYSVWLKEKLFRQIVIKNKTNFKELKVGEEIIKIDNISHQIKELFTEAVVYLLPLFTLILIITCYFFYTDINLGLIQVIFIILCFISAKIIGKRINKLARINAREYYNLNNNIDNSLMNLMNIYINNQDEEEFEKNNKKLERYRKINVKTINKGSVLILFFHICITLMAISTIITSYHLFKKKKINSQKFTMIIIVLVYYIGMLLSKSFKVSNTIYRMGILNYHREELSDNFNNKNNQDKNNQNKNNQDKNNQDKNNQNKNNQNKNNQNKKNQNNQNQNNQDNEIELIQTGDLEFRNLSFKYNPDSEEYVLKNINLIIPKNQKLGILGRSGSGKSTLAKLLIRFYQATEGEILIDNKNINDIDINHLRDTINYVNQNTLLFDKSIYYNIAYGFKSNETRNSSTDNLEENQISDEDKTKIVELLDKYDLLKVYDRLNDNQSKINVNSNNSNVNSSSDAEIQDRLDEEAIFKEDFTQLNSNPPSYTPSFSSLNTEKINNYKNKLELSAGPRGTNLSLGMQKVTIVTRGILKASKILIFDEPLAGLDKVTREKVIKMIINETNNKTLIIITHDKEIIPHLEKVVDLNNINQK